LYKQWGEYLIEECWEGGGGGGGVMEEKGVPKLYKYI